MPLTPLSGLLYEREQFIVLSKCHPTPGKLVNTMSAKSAMALWDCRPFMVKPNLMRRVSRYQNSMSIYYVLPWFLGLRYRTQRRLYLLGYSWCIRRQRRPPRKMVLPFVHGFIFRSLTYLFIRFKRTGNRDKIFLATKFGITSNGPNGKPEYVRSSFEKSLKRLGVENVDLYYFHVCTAL